MLITKKKKGNKNKESKSYLKISGLIMAILLINAGTSCSDVPKEMYRGRDSNITGI